MPQAVVLKLISSLEKRLCPEESRMPASTIASRAAGRAKRDARLRRLTSFFEIQSKAGRADSAP